MDGRIERGGSGIWRAKGGVVRRKTEGKRGLEVDMSIMDLIVNNGLHLLKSKHRHVRQTNKRSFPILHHDEQ